MPRPFLLILAAAALLSASLPAAAQQFLPKTIQFKGDPEYSGQELLAAAGAQSQRRPHLSRFAKFENGSDQVRSLLMRSWQMLPGDPFDENYVSIFLIKAQKDQPAMQRVLAGIKVTYDVRADPRTHEVNCVLRLEKIH